MAEVFPRRLAIINNQADRLRALLAAIVPANPFYTRKFEASGAAKRFPNLERFSSGVPFTFKQELVEDQRVHSPYGSNLTYPLENYSRCHQTSGTAGTPLRWLDTPESWTAMLANWEQILRVAGVTRGDRVFFAFSFGPFIGFWLGFEAAVKIGCLCLPGGGLSSVGRLRAILDLGATVVCGTPTYPFIWPRWPRRKASTSVLPRCAGSSWPANPAAACPPRANSWNHFGPAHACSIITA